MDDSKTAPFCMSHAREGMEDVVSKRCAFQGCTVRNPRFGVPGSRRNVRKTVFVDNLHAVKERYYRFEIVLEGMCFLGWCGSLERWMR